MVTSPNGVVLIGGFSQNANAGSDVILQFEASTGNWEQLTTKLNYPRGNHVAFNIPEEFTNCSNENFG